MTAATKAKTEKKADTQAPYTYAVGKRKTAIARIKLFAKGSGKFEINGKDAKKYFTVGQHIASFLAPLKVAAVTQKSYDLTIKVIGGGPSSQADACRHGLAKALEKENAERRKELKAAGFLTRDSRVKERKKPGLKGARRAPQWAKR